MHDLSLGGPVNIGDQEEAQHSGPCYDGVYGCHLCHDAANAGKGTVSSCDYCKRVTFTSIVRAYDEPVMYELCDACRRVERCAEQVEYHREESRMYDDVPSIETYQDQLDEARMERDRLKDVVDEEAKAIDDKYNQELEARYREATS